MKADNFVLELVNLKPEVEILEKAGYSKNFIKEVLESYEPIIIGNSTFEDSIVELMVNYDMSKIEIGMISFCSKLLENKNLYKFAEFDADAICVNKKDNKIVIVDETSGKILMRCAKNSDSFLDALLTATQLLTQNIIERDFSDNQQLSCEMAIKCSELAGGSKYIDFYKQLFGCWE